MQGFGSPPWNRVRPACACSEHSLQPCLVIHTYEQVNCKLSLGRWWQSKAFLTFQHIRKLRPMEIFSRHIRAWSDALGFWSQIMYAVATCSYDPNAAILRDTIQKLQHSLPFSPPVVLLKTNSHSWFLSALQRHQMAKPEVARCSKSCRDNRELKRNLTSPGVKLYWKAFTVPLSTLTIKKSLESWLISLTC